MKKYSWLILAEIIILGIILRIQNIVSTYFFEGELGRELIYLRQLALDGRFPLVGLTTSHEWLSYGPFYYWIMMPFYKMSGGHPFILFWVGIIVATLAMILNYFVVKKVADKKIALISTTIQAFLPILIWQTRNAKLHLFFLLLVPLFMYFLSLIWNGKKKWVFWAGLTFGLMFSFHFSQIPLLGVVGLLFLIKRNIYKLKDWLTFAAGVVIPNITYIWHDKSLVLWLPYRTLNPATKDIAGTFNSFLEYFGRNFSWDNRFWLIGTVLFIGLFAHYIWKERKNYTKEFLPFYLISSIGLMLLANILHGAFPTHYFLPIFVTFPILIAVYLAKHKYWALILVAWVFMNLPGHIKFEKPEAFVPFNKQLAVADFIVADSKGKPVSIKRFGPYDYFPENYSQNYKYLILWRGGNFVESSTNVYTIIENQDKDEIYVQR